MTSASERGTVAERLACDYLQEQGLTLVARNYRCRVGELDLVMNDGRFVVFVEVRYRRNSRYGTPAETVTHTKQQRLIRAAKHYIQRHGFNLPCRFDIITITQVKGKNTLDWIQDAFQAV